MGNFNKYSSLAEDERTVTPEKNTRSVGKRPLWRVIIPLLVAVVIAVPVIAIVIGKGAEPTASSSKKVISVENESTTAGDTFESFKRKVDNLEAIVTDYAKYYGKNESLGSAMLYVNGVISSSEQKKMSNDASSRLNSCQNALKQLEKLREGSLTAEERSYLETVMTKIDQLRRDYPGRLP